MQVLSCQYLQDMLMENQSQCWEILVVVVLLSESVPGGSFIVGKVQVCVLTDGSKVTVPVAEVYIDSPYLKGRNEAWCMENPVYDLIVGNEPGAKPPNEIKLAGKCCGD